MYNEKGVYLIGDGKTVDEMLSCIKGNIFNVLVSSTDDYECANIMEAMFEWIEKVRSRANDLLQENKELMKQLTMATKEKERLQGMVYALEKQVKEKETKNSTKTEDPW